MFRGPIIWRGFVYACLMATGKLFCGLWLVRFDTRYGCSLCRRNGKGEVTCGTKTEPAAPASAGESMAKPSSLEKPRSLYPASILGAAMIARGEIGFLVSAIAQSNGVFDFTNPGSSSQGSSQELFLIVTWAITLCTVAGPIAVGFLVRRARRLQSQQEKIAGRDSLVDPLGIWGLYSGE